MKTNPDNLIPAGAANAASITLAPVPGSWSDLLSGKNGIYALALAGGVTLHSVNMYIATTVMPSAIVEIGGLDFYAWATTLFVMASILGAALTAKLLKSTSPRSAYVIATLLFAVGTLICSLAMNMPVMLIGRTIQGLGGGFLYALAYAVTRLAFPERLWGRAIGLISAMFGIATLIGPAIGGVFAEIGAWRAAFWSLLPIAALFAVLAFITLPKSGWDKSEKSPVPFLQLALLTAAVLTVSTGSLSSELTWNLVGLGGAVLLIALIAFVDRSAQARLLPTKAFNIATPLGALYLTIALLMISMQPEIFVPYLLQNLHGQSPLWAGYLTALMAAGWSLASLMSTKWQGHQSERLIVGGPVLVLSGLLLLAFFLPIHGAGDTVPLIPICLGLTLIGFGIGLAWPNLVTRVFQNAPAKEQDLASGGMTTVQLFATALGTACAGMVANVAGVAEPGGIVGASNAALWLAGIFALAAILAIAVAAKVVRVTRA